MDIFTSYVGISIAFLLISSLLSFILIYAKIPVIAKLLMIPLVLWFSVALYFIPPKLMGWPTTASLPKNSFVLHHFVREPRDGNKGFIDLLLLVKNDEKVSLLEQLNPVKAFRYTTQNTERLYRLPYTRELHEKLIRAMKKSKKNSGPIGIRSKRGEKNKEILDSSPLAFDVYVIDPNKFYPQKEQ